MVIGKLAEKVWSKMGILDRGGMEPEALVEVVDAYAAVYAALSDDGLVTWAYSAADDADIPDRFWPPLADLIRAEISGLLPPPAEGWDKFRLNATNRIRRQLASSQPTETVQGEYF